MPPRPTATLLACLLIAGCQPADPIVPDDLLPNPVVNEEPLPTYPELVERYNATTEHLGRVWARAKVELEWLDEKGKRKHESGTGRLIYLRPGKTVLEVNEFGKGFWAGSDGERYWFFDRQDDSAVYVGRYDQLDDAKARELPLPVNPRDMPYVLGLKPLDPQAEPDAPAVERLAGYYLIEPPGLSIRMLLDPATTRPVRVDMLDEFGRSEVRCLLQGEARVKLDDVPEPVWPRIADTVDVYVVGTEARLSLDLSGVSGEDDKRKFRDERFDFDKLMRAIKPKTVIDLDAPAE